MGLSNNLSCEAGSFSCCRLNPHGCPQSEVSGFISPHWSPGLRGLFTSPAVPPGLSMHECGSTGSASCPTARPVPQSTTSLGPPAAALPGPSAATLPTSHCPAASPLHPGCPSPPLLLVWMNVSSLSPWLLDFHTVQFSFSSGCFLFLNCCCPFGCVRRHSVSTYTSILAGSHIISFILLCISHLPSII